MRVKVVKKNDFILNDEPNNVSSESISGVTAAKYSKKSGEICKSSSKIITRFAIERPASIGVENT